MTWLDVFTPEIRPARPATKNFAGRDKTVVTVTPSSTSSTSSTKTAKSILSGESHQPDHTALPPWIRRSISGETLDDAAERRCASKRCGAVFMRQPGETDESWGHKRYCSGQCYSGQPWLPVEGVLQ